GRRPRRTGTDPRGTVAAGDAPDLRGAEAAGVGRATKSFLPPPRRRDRNGRPGRLAAASVPPSAERAIDLAGRWLQLRRLELQVGVDYAGAIRLYTRHGFVEEGRHRAFAFRDGACVDALT